MESDNDFEKTMVSIGNLIPISKFDVTDKDSLMFSIFMAIKMIEEKVDILDYSNCKISLDRKGDKIAFKMTVPAMHFTDKTEEDEDEDDE